MGRAGETTNRESARRQGDRIQRRVFFAGIVAIAFGSSVAPAQQLSKRIPQVGILTPAENGATPNFEAFRRGLGEFGHVEGQNIILQYRFAREEFAALPGLADELARCRST